MTDDEAVKVADDLVNWLRKRNIGPTDGIPILASVIVVGVWSTGKAEGWSFEQRERSVRAAAEVVIETHQLMMLNKARVEEKH